MSSSSKAAQEAIKFQKPPRFKVIYFDDSKTQESFIIDTLMEYFMHDYTSANKILRIMEEDGQAVVAVMDFEIADQKVMEVVSKARKNEFPLRVSIEKDV